MFSHFFTKQSRLLLLCSMLAVHIILLVSKSSFCQMVSRWIAWNKSNFTLHVGKISWCFFRQWQQLSIQMDLTELAWTAIFSNKKKMISYEVPCQAEISNLPHFIQDNKNAMKLCHPTSILSITNIGCPFVWSHDNIPTCTCWKCQSKCSTFPS